MTYDEWLAEGIGRFGTDRMQWRFVCPSCGYEASVQEWMHSGAPYTAVAYSCIGRWTDSAKEFGDRTGGPCNYAGGGLIGLNPVTVTMGDKSYNVFAFAEV